MHEPFEGPDFEVIRETIVITRKPWTCSACKHPMPAGTKARVVVFTEDGVFEAQKECPDLVGGCAKDLAREAGRMAEGDDG